MNTGDLRLDELVNELDEDAKSAVLREDFVNGVVRTAQWQRTVRGGLESVLRLLDAFSDALKQALGAPRK